MREFLFLVIAVLALLLIALLVGVDMPEMQCYSMAGIPEMAEIVGVDDRYLYFKTVDAQIGRIYLSATDCK